MDKPPSPSCSRSSLFLVGRNSRGNWVVQDQKAFAEACSSIGRKP